LRTAQQTPWQGRIDSGPNWSKAKAAVAEVVHHLLDPVQLGLGVGIFGLLPGPGALEGDVVGVQDLA
jgi:hypothetical protein